MCNEHSATIVRVLIPADLSYSGEEHWKDAGIDTCIAPLVRALQEGGVNMRASCCGHGHRPGNIALADGRELIVAADFEMGRAVDAAFPISSYGEPVQKNEAEGAES